MEDEMNEKDMIYKLEQSGYVVLDVDKIEYFSDVRSIISVLDSMDVPEGSELYFVRERLNAVLCRY